jgi:glycosyltransferase involved in cell wall biosynthesis
MRSTINVLHLLNGEQYSGIERVVDHLAESAPGHGFRLHLACLKPGDMPSRLKTSEARLHFVGMRSRIDLTGILALRRIALRENCQLLHSHTVRSAMVARALKTVLPIPWVHHVHSPAKYESENKSLNYCNYLVEKMTLPKADIIIPVSVALREYALTYYNINPEKLILVRNGVATQNISLDNFSNKAGVRTIGAVGLFRPRKGVEILLKAFEELVALGMNVRLKLIGEFANDEYQKIVEEQLDHAGLVQRVEITGFQQNVRDQLATLDVFVMPSLFGEGLPMALLEAMAMGRTIIASRVDGITETLDDGPCAILVPPGDAAALTKAIKDVLSDCELSRKLALAAKNRQQTCYGLNVMEDAIFDIYNFQLS